MVRFLIIIAILILALSFFGISIRAIVQSPTGQDNFSFVWDMIQNGWHILTAWFALIVATIKQYLPHQVQ